MCGHARRGLSIKVSNDIEENPWPIEVLVENFKWFSVEKRLQKLAPVCKLFHQAVHTPKFWKIVDTNSEFKLTLS